MFKLGMFLLTGLNGIYAWIVATLGARAALAVATVGLITTCMAALLFMLKNIVLGMFVYVAYPPFLMGFFAALPANWATVIASMFTADAAMFACRYHYALIASLAKQ